MRPDEVSLGRVRPPIASVAISIISQFAPDSFRTTHHLTMVNFSQQGWSYNACGILDLYDAFPIPTDRNRTSCKRPR